MAPPVASPAPTTRIALVITVSNERVQKDRLDTVRFWPRDLKSRMGQEATDAYARVLVRLWQPGLLSRLHPGAADRAAHRRRTRLSSDAARRRVQGDRQPLAGRHQAEGRVDDGGPAAVRAALRRALRAQSELPDQHPQPDARRHRSRE